MAINHFCRYDLPVTMEKDFAAWLHQFQGQGFDLHAEHLNPAFVKMLPHH